jgi:hypothetical protein
VGAFAIALLVVGAVVGAARADPLGDADAAQIREGARIDAECLKRDKIKDIGDCRRAATSGKQPDMLMIGFTFHMWFSDVLLAELYRNRAGKADVAALFENLADAEYPPLYAAKEHYRLAVSELCRMTEIDCAIALRYDRQWFARLGQKQP